MRYANRIFVILLAVAAAQAAHAAQSWGVTAEEIARYEAKVVDILCELTGDCAANCGDGKRQLGLLTKDDKLVLVTKNSTAFTGAAEELVDFCAMQVIVDGLFTEHRGVRMFAVQFIREAPDGKWRGANRFLGKWAVRNGLAPDAKEANQWFRHDRRVMRLIERDGYLGLGKEVDKQYFESR
ncbi:MAG: hypothetical protein V3R72_00440 [Gammaproteobacteria bacterium]